MARKKTKPAPDQTADIDADAIEADAQLMDENNHRLAMVDAQVNNNLPYDKNRLIHETQFYLQQSAGALLEAGRRLILLKEHETHGDWTDALESIGIAPRAARRMMQASIKFSKRSTSTVLLKINQSKLIELLSEDDEDLAELEDGGTIAGMTLDDIDRMTVRELRTTLREARKKEKESAEVNERLLSEKDKKINELDSKLYNRANSDIAVQCDELAMELERETQGVLGALLGVEVTIKRVFELPGLPQPMKVACLNSAQRVRAALDELHLNYLDFVAVPNEPGEDDWIAEAKKIQPSENPEG